MPRPPRSSNQLFPTKPHCHHFQIPRTRNYDLNLLVQNQMHEYNWFLSQSEFLECSFNNDYFTCFTLLLQG